MPISDHLSSCALRVDVVYESVGGATFDTCVKNIAVKGTILVIGAVSQYQDQTAWDASKGTLSSSFSSSRRVLALYCDRSRNSYSLTLIFFA